MLLINISWTEVLRYKLIIETIFEQLRNMGNNYFGYKCCISGILLLFTIINIFKI